MISVLSGLNDISHFSRKSWFLFKWKINAHYQFS
jgi:hypothetical protein